MQETANKTNKLEVSDVHLYIASVKIKNKRLCLLNNPFFLLFFFGIWIHLVS